MNKIIFQDIEIYHEIKPNIKHSYISVSKEAKVILKTPNISKKLVDNILKSKEKWIKKQLASMILHQPPNIKKRTEVLLFDRIYNITDDEVKYLHDLLKNIKTKTDKNIQRCYNDFYKHMSHIYLTPRIKYFSDKMGLSFRVLRYKKLESRWGSCSSNGAITLNTQLLKIKKELIDYVIVHELAHLVYMNHSKDFHNLVDNYLPNSKFLKKQLKDIILN
jgi:predicted metal-dependent hydrolase